MMYERLVTNSLLSATARLLSKTTNQKKLTVISIKASASTTTCCHITLFKIFAKKAIADTRNIKNGIKYKICIRSVREMFPCIRSDLS